MSMRILMGYNEYLKKKEGKEVPVYWDPNNIINAHLMVAGKSGTGKTTRLMDWIKQVTNSADDTFERFHIFDVHGDIEIPGESRMEFSGLTRYGYNPLVLDPDVRSGGVNRQITFLITTINKTSRKLMDRQEATLRNLLVDLYAFFGIHEERPETWQREEMTEAMRDEIWRDRRFGDLKRYYPTLRDAIGFAERRLKAMYGGLNGHESGFKAVGALEQMNSAAQKMQKSLTKKEKAFDTEDKERAQKDFESAAAKFKEKVDEYIAAIETGLEFDNLIKYESKETLKSVIDRLKNFEAKGIFNANPPQFDPDAKVWAYDLTALSDEERTLFCMVRAEVIARRRRLAGKLPRGEVREIIVADEAPTLFDENPDSIYNRIAKQLRKFGLALWALAQTPSDFPEGVLTTVGTKVLLGIDSFYWKSSCSKLNIEDSVLKYITPWKSMAVYMDQTGKTNARFYNVELAGAIK